MKVYSKSEQKMFFPYREILFHTDLNTKNIISNTELEQIFINNRISFDSPNLFKWVNYCLTYSKYQFQVDRNFAPNRVTCSTFIWYVYKQIGIKIPDLSILQFKDPTITIIDKNSQYQEGDLIFLPGSNGRSYEEIGHVMMRKDKESIVHACYKSKKVVTEEFSQIDRGRIIAIGRILPEKNKGYTLLLPSDICVETSEELKYKIIIPEWYKMHKNK